MRLFGWIVSMLWAITGLFLLIALLFRLGADNGDAAATAGLAFLPVIFFGGIAGLVSTIYGLARLIGGR